MHGGKSLRGIAHPAYVNGSRSRYRLGPGKFGERYTEQLQDADYIALRDELAIITAKIQSLIEDDFPASGCQRCDTVDAQSMLSDLVDLRRKLADTEAKRIKLAHDTLTGEQIRAFGDAVLAANRRRADQYLPREKVAAFLSDVQNDVRSIVQSLKG